MIRQDFISKYIEELGKALRRLIDYEVSIQDENFIFHFNEMLYSYYKISDDSLDILLTEDTERDQFLLADELKKVNIRAFLKASSIYLSQGENNKALQCFNITERVQKVNSDVFQFPTEEDLLITKEYNNLKDKFNTLT